MRLQGKTAIVTGAASGFGEGIAARFAAEGAAVVVADIDGNGARRVAAEIGGTAHRVDVADAADVAALAAAHPEPDIVVNNAGVTHRPGPLEDVAEDAFDRVLRVNAKSIYLMARAFVPGMKARRAGAILNMASTAALSPRPGLNWYNASKGWVVTATRTMAVELAPHGVRVNALCPVAGDTPLLPSFLGEDTPERRAAFLATIPMGRFSTPADLAAAAVYLCSDEASLVTGVALEIDGGRCI